MQQQPQQCDGDNKREVLFLNLTVQDGSQAVKAKVAKRLALLPSPVKNHAAQRASTMTTTKKITQHLSQKLQKKLPLEMKERGITVDMEELFREGPYVVLQLRILHVDTVVLAASTKKNKTDEPDGFSKLVQWFIVTFGEGFQKAIEDEFLPKHILNHLAKDMPRILADRMDKEKMVVETKVLKKREAQLEYFNAKVEEIREHERSRGEGIISKVRKRISSFNSSNSGNASVASQDENAPSGNGFAKEGC